MKSNTLNVRNVKSTSTFDELQKKQVIGQKRMNRFTEQNLRWNGWNSQSQARFLLKYAIIE